MKHKAGKCAKETPPRQILRFQHLDQSKSEVINNLPSKESQRGYRHAIDEFIGWYCSEPRLSFNKARRDTLSYAFGVTTACAEHAALCAGDRTVLVPPLDSEEPALAEGIICTSRVTRSTDGLPRTR